MTHALRGRWLSTAFRAAFTAAVLAALAWALWPGEATPAAAAAPVAATSALRASAPPVLAAGAESGSSPAAAARVDCPHQFVDVTGAHGLQRGCLSATQTRQSGSVRSHLARAEGTSAWQLTVDVAGETVLSVRLLQAPAGNAPPTLYVCDGAACAGASLGAVDAQGARTLALAGTRVQALAPGQRWQRPQPGVEAPRRPASQNGSGRAAGALPALSIKAVLRLAPDRQNPALACSGHVVNVVESRGAGVAAFDFCPQGGAGFDLAEDGTLRFSFRDLEGRELVVALAADRRGVDAVWLGALGCRSPQCGSVVMATPNGDAQDPAAERHFGFSGTMLTAPGAASNSASNPTPRSATLAGSVTMPAQP